jgi:hypothetical protein
VDYRARELRIHREVKEEYLDAPKAQGGRE